MRFDIYSKTFKEVDENQNKVVISASDGHLTWIEFEGKVNEAKKALNELKAPAGHPIVIYGHKEKLFMVWEVACVQLCIPFIPFDSVYPTERLNTIISETGSEIVVNLSNCQLDHTAAITVFEDFRVECKYSPDFEKARLLNESDPLMYMIFTSGSTGTPKGVMISHSNYCTLIRWMESDYGFTNSNVFMNQAVFSFDLSMYDNFFALHTGGKLLTISRELAGDYDRFLEHIKKEGCTVWTSTPSTAFIYLQSANFNDTFLPHLTTFLFIGEALPERTVLGIESRFPNARILNAYGPTEASVATTLIEVSSALIAELGEVPIGDLKNKNCIELVETDEQGVGEIVITGKHVSSGYFKKDELTKLKFSGHAETRSFKTGDLGLIRNNVLFFRGRNDDQIKLRGYRIELGEISSKVSELYFVKHAEAVALARKNVVKKVVCFVELSQEIEGELREKCKLELVSTLPDYMIPSDFREIQKWPLNPNQKIDRKQLVELYIKK